MNRRNFLRNGSLAGLSLATLSMCKSGPEVKNEAGQAGSQIENFKLEEASISELQQMMGSGALTAVTITQLYLDRIKAIDAAGPKLNSVIEVNPDALSIAAAMDAERKNGKVRGQLHGIPVLIKDNIGTNDKMQTTAGSLALAGHIAPKDAFIVRQLRQAGAVLLGKTNLSEWANFRSSHSSSGWSSRGGQTRNPYLLTHNPCGSSAGSGVATAANLCTVAVGTETDGSITCPSSVNGIVGLKPTVGLLSRSGIIPISHTQDTAGPMARTVKDAAILLGVLAGADPTDEKTAENAGKIPSDYTKFLDANALKGKRIGVEKKFQGDNLHMIECWNKAKALLIKQGAEIIEIEYLDKINALAQNELIVLKYEFKHGLNKYLASSGAKIKSLHEVIAYNNANAEKAMPYFTQDILESSDKLSGLETKEYLQSLAKSHIGSRNIIDEVIKKHQLDAISGLTMGPACSIDLWYGDRWGDVSLTTPAATSGYPHITVPCGLVYDLPVGLSFFSGAYTEPQLISLAYSFEQAFGKRPMPAFKHSIE
ncbi:amidase [Flavihumibacter profundi]|uniref:amidase n=1 Tax=Flavihumibacter profundi TaxID=2716883 RepID=UPI001CC66849|nr:amidase [Flavihumibacter profundi]MBZ5855967.1 amidase [Flavihumibacter profundi]